MITYLGLGANLGDRVKKLPNVKLLRVSSFYETAAWGVTNQPDFINATIKIQTTLTPLKLLDELQKIETEIETIRHEHWAARIIDIDILLIDGLEINSPRLIVPHKFLYERDFAMIPLAEISPLKFDLRGDKVQKIFGSPIDFNLALIACVDKNFGIGYKGDLLFRIAEDLKNFRKLTLNHTVIYGRKTLKTFPNGKPLDSRTNIIFSRSVDKIDDAEIVHSVEELFTCKLQATTCNLNFVIGGAEIFNELLPYATKIYLTVVDVEKNSDVKFPNFDSEFIKVEEKNLQATSYNLQAMTYERVNYGK